MSAFEIAPGKWTLADLLPSADEEVVSKALAALEVAIARVEGYRLMLDAEMAGEVFTAALADYEEAYRHIQRLGAYASLWFTADTQNQAALSFKNRIDQTLVKAENRLLFFGLWWKSLGEAEAERLMEFSGGNRYHLYALRLFKPYTLTEAEEQLVNLKDVHGISALVELYDMLTNRYTFEITIDGETKKLTRDGLSIYFRHPDPLTRETAYKELYKVYSEQGNVLGQIYSHRALDWTAEQMGVRHFASPISVRNLSNDLPDEVVDTLLDVARRNAGVFQDYFRLKASSLGLAKLRRYDLYAPLSSADKDYPYAEAVKMVLDCFAEFSPEMAAHARRVFDEQHIDAEIRPGKRGGAFCASLFPGSTPYILTGYAGKVRDATTLAHELGHAVHALMAGDKTLFTFHATLPLAETASVFGEMLLTERLLKQEREAVVRRDILVKTLDDAYATVLRQAFFVIFEREAHRDIQLGVSIDQLSQRYYQNLSEQFGDAVEISDDFRWEWVSIPHIYHTPFYCYAYSFGQLLVLALYRRYQEEGRAFIPRYLRILSQGGSATPKAILAEAGIDINDAQFWQNGFDILREMVDELAVLQKGLASA